MHAHVFAAQEHVKIGKGETLFAVFVERMSLERGHTREVYGYEIDTASLLLCNAT